MIGWMLRAAGLARSSRPTRAERTRTRLSFANERVWSLLAGYDAAKSDGVNQTHWTNADGLSAQSANSPDVRQRLRERARYEAGNNTICSGIVDTLANDTIGTGPMLRVNSGSRKTDRSIERAWRDWANDVGLADKLRRMRRSKAVDGEVYGLLFTNPLLDDVTLDIRLIEGDQVSTPDLPVGDPLAIDGIRFDEAGNPVEYHVLKHHPGDDRGLGDPVEYDRVPASLVIHYSHAARPGEVRGVPEITPALSLFAILRRYTLAAVTNAETAANIAGTLESDVTEGDPDELEPLDAVELEPNTFLTMPQGWKAKGFRGEQPATGFKEFRREIINEIARCLNMPLNIALASSEGYNYSSGRLDHGVYYHSIEIERALIERVILHRIFRAWLSEAMLVPGLIEGEIRSMREIAHDWRWPAFPSGDPEKDAKAAVMLRDAGLLSLDRYHTTRHGADWEREAEQMAAEAELMRELGLEDKRPSLSVTQDQQDNTDQQTETEGATA